MHARRHHRVRGEVPAAPTHQNFFRGRSFFLFQNRRRRRQPLSRLPSLFCSIRKHCSRNSLTQGSGGRLQKRAWGRQSATERAPSEEKREEQRPQSPPSKSATTLKQQSQTSTSSSPQPPLSPSSPSSPSRASLRARRDAASSKPTRGSETEKAEEKQVERERGE